MLPASRERDAPVRISDATGAPTDRAAQCESILPLTFAGVPVDDFAAPWHVVQIESGKEKAFVEDCIRREVPYFAPWRIHRVRTECRHTRVRQLALFPGYCFLAVPFTSDAADCRGYLCDVKGTQGAFTQRQLRDDLSSLYRFLLTDPQIEPAMPRGTRVRISQRDHPLFGVEGRVVTHDAGRQLVIEVRFLGRECAAQIVDEMSVEVLDDAA
jgi:hypothetical protein